MTTLADLTQRWREHGYGRQVTSAHTETRGGCLVVVEAPDQLAIAAGCGLDQYSLARLAAAEGYGSRLAREVTTAGRAAAAAAIMQSCLAKGRRHSPPWPASRVVTWHSAPQLVGRFGEQRGRFASTARDPSEWHVEVARAVLAGELPDLARGSTNFLDPAVWLDGGGMQGGRKLQPLEEVLTRWHQSAAWIGPIPTVALHYLVMLAPESDRWRRTARLRELLVALKDPGARLPACEADPGTGPLVA